MSADSQDKSHFIQADKDGQFRRPDSGIRNTIPSKRFPAEAGRYALYLNLGCPWAHRTNIIRTLKGLEDIIELIEVDDMDPLPGKGWYFSGRFGPDKCPNTGVKYLRELYLCDNPQFTGRTTVPLLWDKATNSAVNNESSEIVRIFCTGFDDLLPTEGKEISKGPNGLLPSHLISEINAMNAWIYDTINNGVYKAGFATKQEVYSTHAHLVFESLDRLESHLADLRYAGPYLFGDHITEADIRLYPTLVRFDVAYYFLFKLNLKMIRHDYPRLHKWLRTLYWDESEATKSAFKNTTRFDRYKANYGKVTGETIVPIGPKPDIMPL